jgi:transcription elongation factor Elf1
MTEQELINYYKVVRAKFDAECTEECPRCNQITLHSTPGMNALCRRDNKTYICSACGTEQAFEDLARLIGSDQ